LFGMGARLLATEPNRAGTGGAVLALDGCCVGLGSLGAGTHHQMYAPLMKPRKFGVRHRGNAFRYHRD